MYRKRTSGLDIILKKLNKEVNRIEKRSLRGLIRAAIVIRRSMDKRPPLIPVDLGNLRASFFTVTSNGSITSGKQPNFKGEDSDKLSSTHSATVSASTTAAKQVTNGPAVILGFTAYYAWFVHENLMAMFQRPMSGPKFFEAALKINKKEILEKIKQEAKV